MEMQIKLYAIDAKRVGIEADKAMKAKLLLSGSNITNTNSLLVKAGDAELLKFDLNK